MLRPDGLVWLNLGDGYANPGHYKGNPGDHGTIGRPRQADQELAAPYRYSKTGDGLKNKDLLLMPPRVALALQADGWYVRSTIPWLKRNAMPESVRDRPATSTEYVFLLAKSERYYYDAEAVRLEGAGYGRGTGPGAFRSARYVNNASYNNSAEIASNGSHGHSYQGGRARRNSDWFLETWQGLLLDEDGDPLALVVNPMPFSQAHFATFPPKLVEPMVKASTSERGECPECGAPWRRVVDRVATEPGVTGGATWAEGEHIQTSKGLTRGGGYGGGSVDTTGWEPSCGHVGLEPVPQTILDPFGGAGTAGLVADRLGRHAVLCDLNAEYVDMGATRITQDAPLFTQVELL